MEVKTAAIVTPTPPAPSIVVETQEEEKPAEDVSPFLVFTVSFLFVPVTHPMCLYFLFPTDNKGRHDVASRLTRPCRRFAIPRTRRSRPSY